MADPTIKDVLAAMAVMRAETKSDLATLRAEMNGRFDGVDARFDAVDVRFDAVDKSIAELGVDIDKHMVVHKKLEKQVETLKAKPVRPAVRMPRRR